MRATRAHRDNRRSHHALTATRLTACPECKAPHAKHRACLNCGKYNGRVVIDVKAKIAKKETKRKKKAVAAK
jgi:large subunit ribosomal protein L32